MSDQASEAFREQYIYRGEKPNLVDWKITPASLISSISEHVCKTHWMLELEQKLSISRDLIGGLETDILSIYRIHLPNYSLVLRSFRNRLLARAFPADAPSAGGISL